MEAQGTHWFRTLPSSHKIPDEAPSLAVHVTKHAESVRGVDLVVYLHGWQGCPRVLLSAQRVACREGGPIEEPFALRAAVEQAKLPVVFVVPQLSFWKRSGAPGRFRDPAYTKEWLDVLTRLPPLRQKRIRSITLVAHSAGFQTALAFLSAAPNAIDQVVMLDALYDGGAVLGRWVLGADDRRALTLTLGRGDTWRQSRLAERMLRRKLGDVAIGRPSLEHWERGARFKNVRASTNHRNIPRKQLAEILRLLLE